MNFMKKSALAAGVALAMGMGASGTAQALSITVTTMEFYDAGGNPQFFGGGLNTSVVGSINDAGTGTMTSGSTPFFGTPWVANQVMFNDNHTSTQTWAGTSASGAFSYNYNLTGNQIAVGLYFTWGAASEIAVLQIFDCPDGAAGACVGVNNDAAHPGVPGTEMANGPFAGQHATFKGVTADIWPQSGGSPVPVPAAVWLFGSGLVGLVGVARRKKQA